MYIRKQMDFIGRRFWFGFFFQKWVLCMHLALQVCNWTYKIVSIVLGFYSFPWGDFFFFRLIYLACSVIILIASPSFIHYGSIWKITMERISVSWNLILLRNGMSSLRQIILIFNCPRSLACFSLFDLFQFLGMVPSHRWLVKADQIGGAGERRNFRCTNECWILTQHLSSTDFKVSWNWVFCRG